MLHPRFFTLFIVAALVLWGPGSSSGNGDSHILTAPPHPSQNISPEFAHDIRMLIALQHQKKAMLNILPMIVKLVSEAHPEVPKKFWETARQDLDLDGLVELLVPVYAKHFSHDEVRGLIAFYQSPLGQRFSSENIAMMDDTTKAGQYWGRQCAERWVQRAREKGYAR